MHPKKLKIEDYTYDLPPHRIAQHPLKERDASKLLVFNAKGSIEDAVFRDLHQHVPSQSLLIFNETRVIRARLIFPRGEGLKPIELFCIDPFDTDIESAMSATQMVRFNCMVGNAKRWKDEQLLEWKNDGGETILEARKLGRDGSTFQVEFSWTSSQHFAGILEELGQMPLPPYMRRSEEPDDADRYQTVYATRDGSVAAPTAGLHFTDRVFDSLKQNQVQLESVVLHVGAGTFKPVSSDTMDGHDMHSEAIEVSAALIEKIASNPSITAVGTTSCRTLESLYWLGVQVLNERKIDFGQVYVGQWEPYEQEDLPSTQEALSALLNEMSSRGVRILRGKTQIIIAPGYTYRVIHRLITNFHQPASTLILLVAAGLKDNWKKVYAHALENEYRFLSYGDSSLLHIR